MRQELREKYESLRTNEAWKAAEKFLMKYGYTNITIDIMDMILPEWRTVIEESATFEEKVRYLVHEAVEIEEVYRALGTWIEPRLAGERGLIDLTRIHLKAERLSGKYVHQRGQFKRRSVRDVIENPGEDEFTVLVMRYVPMEIRRRGLKIREVFEEWDRDLAPSPNLIRWWKEGSRTAERWKEYQRRYLKEVSPTLIKTKTETYRERARGKEIVLVCREEDSEYPYCHTWIILNVIRCDP